MTIHRSNGRSCATHDHPQIAAFSQAAELIRDQRYWCRNDDDEINFLQALADVVREVSYHLDAVQALSFDGMAAYCNAAGLHPWGGNANAEFILMTAVDAAIEQRIATATTARNTGHSTEASK